MPAIDLNGSAYVYAHESTYIDVATNDYLPVLQDLLPYGPAWTRRPGAWLTRLLEGLGREASRVELQAARLVEESDPRTTQELLSDWESFAGLPGCAAEVPDTVEGRQAALWAKLTRNVNPNPTTFQVLAEGLGYTDVVVTRSEARPFTVGSSVGDSLRGGPWAHAFSITTAESTDNDALLRCIVRQMVPRHAVVIFNLGTVGV